MAAPDRAPTSETVHAWARAHDVESLRAIARHRAALVAMSPSADAALALGRLLDTEGASSEVVDAVNAAMAHAADDTERARLALVLAKAEFEAGRVDDARARLLTLATADEAETALTARFVSVRLSMICGDESVEAELAEARSAYGASSERWPWVDSLALGVEAALALRLGHKRQAQLLYERALDAALGYDGAVEGAVLAGLLGNIELDLGHHAAAKRWFDTAVELAERADTRSTAAIFGGYRGWALAHLGDEQAVDDAYAEAVAACRALGLGRFEAQFAALRATTQVTGEDVERREVALRQALSALAATGDVERADGLRVLQVILDTVRARTEGASDVERQRRLITAFGRLCRAHELSDDARLAKRAAARAFDAALGADSGDHALALVPGAERGRGPRGAFDFTRHATLARLLWALVEAWADDRRANDDELIAATWPGDKLLADAATHRLQVAVSSLRKRALGTLLVREADGYRLEVDGLSLVRESSIEPD